VEGAHKRIQLTSNLNQLTAGGEILLKYVNPFMTPVKLPAGPMLGRLYSVQKEDVRLLLGDAAKGSWQRLPKGQRTIPPHVKELYEAACGSCVSNEKGQAMAKLLSEYNDVFSKGDHDMGLTQAVRHEIPLVAGSVPNRQLTRRLGPKKEKEVS